MGNIIVAILVLSIVIFIHELGHFLAAKRGGVGVEIFSIGFGTPIWKRKIGDTEYRISMVPLGGYVKMVGDNPDEEVTEPEKSFLLKPLWKRSLIVAAGPVFNLLSAVLIIHLVFMAGVPSLLPTIGAVEEGMPADEAGLEPGDTILAVDGEKVENWEDLTEIVHPNEGVAMAFSIRRGEEMFSVTIAPRLSTSENIFGEEVSIGLIGITPAKDYTTTLRYGPLKALGMSVQWTYFMAKVTLTGVVKMIQGRVPADNIGGPIMIVQAVGQSAEQGFLNLLYFMAYISVMLGLINLFPIPVLDGGHLLFFLIEAVRGRPMSLRKREILQQVGLVILISLMLFATKNDIFRLFER